MLFRRLALSEVKTAMKREGPIAARRVIVARCHGAKRKSKKPSITTCPAKVVDMVEARPAAKSPTAQMVNPHGPMVEASASPASSNPISAHV